MHPSLPTFGVLTSLLLLLGPFPAQAQEGTPKAKPSVRTDKYGDPLPEGAIARLGTLRLVHRGNIFAMAVSPDDAVAATGVFEGKEEYHAKRIVCADGPVTIFEDIPATKGSIRLWETKTGKRIHEIEAPDSPVTDIRFAPDGKTFIAACGMFLCCFETATGNLVWSRESVWEAENRDLTTFVDIVFGKGCLLTAHYRIRNFGSDYVIQLWDPKTGAPLSLPKTLESPREMRPRNLEFFSKVSVSQDGRLVAVLVSERYPVIISSSLGPRYVDQRIDIVDVPSGKILHRINDLMEGINHLAFSSDGKTLALVAEEKEQITCIRLDTGKKRHLNCKLPAPIRRVAFAENDKFAAVLSDDSVQLWDVASGNMVNVHTFRCEHFEPSRGRSVAAIRYENRIRLVDVESSKPVQSFDGHDRVSALRFSMRSPNTLISHDGTRATWWDTRYWTPKRSMLLFKQFTLNDPDCQFDAALSVESGLACKEMDSDYHLVEAKSGKFIRKLERGDGRGRGWSFSADGKRLAQSGAGVHVFYDVATGKRLSQIEDDVALGYVGLVHWELSPRGKYFAVNGDWGTIHNFDVATGKPLSILMPPRALGTELDKRQTSIFKFHFSHDERLVYGETHQEASSHPLFSQARISVLVWQAATGEMLQDIGLGLSMPVYSRPRRAENTPTVLTLSNDHRFVALTRALHDPHRHSDRGSTIELYEVASGQKRGELKGHEAIADLQFSPDTQVLASSSDDGTILIWDMNRPLHPVKRAERLSEKELADCWQTLLQKDAVKGDGAIWKMVYAAQDTVPFLKKKLQPAVMPETWQVRKLIAELGSVEYKTRVQAEAELIAYRDLVLAELEKSLKEGHPLETQRRLEGITQKARSAARLFGSDEAMRQWRALEILERIGTPEAREVIAALAKGVPGARLTQAAQMVVGRLSKSP